MKSIKNILCCCFIVLILIFFSHAKSGAETLEVWPDQTPNSTPIQDAIDFASNGDVVVVHFGIYRENINFRGKIIVVRSDGDVDPATYDISPGRTIIEGRGPILRPIVKFENGETKEAVIDGFTIRNGDTGIDVGDLSNPTIKNCKIFSNHVDGDGGGIGVGNASATIINCLFQENSASEGGGLSVQDSSIVYVINCTFIKNSGEDGGGFLCKNSSATVLSNCLFWQNTGIDGHEIAVKTNSTVTINYSNVQGGIADVFLEPGCILNWSNDTNINADPLFVSDGDYHLTKNSPCIDKGKEEDAPDTDIDGDSRPQGAGYDIGADEYVAKAIQIMILLLLND